MNQTDDDNDNGDDDDDDDDGNDNELRNILHCVLIKQSLYSPFKENKYDMKNYVELVGCCPPQPSASVDNTPSIYIILHTIKNVGVNVAFVLTFSCIYLSHFTSLYLIKTEKRNSFFMDQFKPNYQEISNYRENEYFYWKVSDRFFTRKDTHAAGFLKVHRIIVSRGDW